MLKLRVVVLPLLLSCTLPPRDGNSGSSGGQVQSASSSSGTMAMSAPPQVRPSNTTCLAPPRPSTDATIALQRVFANLSFNDPVLLLQAPGSPGFFYVVERTGKVRRFVNSPEVTSATDVITVTVRSGPGEAGLLGMAFHPGWQQNHTVFLSYTDRQGSTGLRSVLSRFTSNDDGATLGGEEILLTLEQPYDNHNGGHIAFGPDGYLYFALGDGGSGGDPLDSGQDLTSLLGKILRIDVDNGTPYGIPPGNPFTGPGERREIFAYGLRNPWRFSFDRELGNLWAGDVGQDIWEEIDLVTRGGNYGWRLREARHCFNPRNNCPTADLVEPVFEYNHSDGQSVTGGYVYRGSGIPALYGTYVFGDYESGIIWGSNVDTATPEPQRELAQGSSISSFAEDLDGELYVINYGAGTFHKIVPGTGMVPETFPQLLSQTGCVDATDPTRPAAGLIPYDVSDPFWSDGADKTRFLAMPDGTTIDIRPDGDFDFPLRTVLVKTFRLGSRLVETRLFMRHGDGEWGGYTYEWNDQGTDATLLTSVKQRRIDGQDWTFPSRAQCLQCHNDGAGRSLGLEIAQLNREVTYSNGARINQLQGLTEMGLFTTPPAPPYALLDRLAPSDGMAPVAERARTYLHTNCAYCHRPDGAGRGKSDLRFTTSEAEMQICNELPEEGDLGVTGARVVVPGNPSLSLLHLRMSRRGVSQMPPLASAEVDPLGAALIADWITGLTGCP